MAAPPPAANAVRPSLAATLSARRAAAGLTQRALAKRAGVAQSLIAGIEAGALANPTLDSLTALAGGFKCSVAVLLGDEPPPEPASAAPAVGVRLLAYGQIVASDFNPRKHFDDAALDELAASIADKGILQNLVARPLPIAEDPEGPTFEIVAGERRWRAVGRLVAAGRWDPAAPAIPVLVQDLSDADARAVALLENLRRVDINPMEEAEALAELHRLDPAVHSTAAIARQLGATQRHVQLRLNLVDRLCPEVRDALREGRITLAQARAMLGAPAATQKHLLRGIGEGKSWSLRADDLRRQAFADLVPAADAIFALDQWPGEIVEDEDGNRFLAGAGLFQQEQRKAAEALAETLRGTWAWAEVATWFSATAHEDARSDDRTAAGAVVVCDYRGKVTVETGLVKRRAHVAAAGQWEERRAERARRAQAAEDFRAALADRLAEDPQAALTALLFTLLVYHDGCLALDQPPPGPHAARFRECFAAFMTDERRADEDDDTLLAFTAADDLPGLWHALRDLDRITQDKLLAALAADALSIPDSETPGPLITGLAARLAVPLPEFWQPAAPSAEAD